jgi:hypothetical protein
MINAATTGPPTEGPTFSPHVIEGGLMFDVERLSQTMAMLEGYVESMLAAYEPPAKVPYIDEEDIRLRVASL